MSKTSDILKHALEKATGEKIKRVWWKPLGKSFEMQGPQGGWMFEYENGDEDCMGTSAEMAIDFVIDWAVLNSFLIEHLKNQSK